MAIQARDTSWTHQCPARRSAKAVFKEPQRRCARIWRSSHYRSGHCECLERAQITGDPFGVAGKHLIIHTGLTEKRQHDLCPFAIGDDAQGDMDFLAISGIDIMIHQPERIVRREADRNRAFRSIGHPSVAFLTKIGFGEA